MKILIAVDGSAGGFEAVRQAGQLLDATRDQVALYYSPPQIKFGADIDADVVTKARASLAEVVFSEARGLLPEALRTSATTIAGDQSPKTGIVAAAESSGANLIAVGARGLGALHRILLGSVSTTVVNTSKLPVLIARPRPAARATSPLKVLAACKSAETDKAMARLLSELHCPAGTQGFVISIVQSMFAGHVPDWLKDRAHSPDVEAMAQVWIAEHEAEIVSKRQELENFRSTLPEPFHASAPIVVEGNAADQILAAVASQHIDLVVLGPRGASSVSRMLIGSTSTTVLNHAPCSVLVTKG